MEIDHELEARGLRLVADHINRVQRHMAEIIGRLALRAINHDQSKYSEAEIGLVINKPALDKHEYMSAEQERLYASVRDAIDHHYAHNRHHPEYYQNGVDDMSLMSLLIAAADWKAAGEVQKNGGFRQSVEHNTKRFGLSPQLVSILISTGRELGWIDD